MNKVSSRFRKFATGLGALLLVTVVAFSVYSLLELKGLRARVNTLESSGTAFNSAPEGEIEYTIVSSANKKIRTESTDISAYKALSQGAELEYIEKDVQAIKVRIKNNSTNAYSFDAYSISAKTESGVLISPVIAHPDDQDGQQTLSLAPGGSGETTLYIENQQNQKIVGLFDMQTNQQIDLKQ